MQVGLIGIGRMGKALIPGLAEQFELWIYDRDPANMETVAEKYPVFIAKDLAQIAESGVVILVVPDREVVSCLKELNQIKKPVVVINAATNVARYTLQEMAAGHVKCIGAKFVGQAGEIVLGQKPVIIIDDQPADLVPLVKEIFAGIGPIVVGKADMVTYINTVAAEAVLEAAVRMEESLRYRGITEPVVIQTAIRQVGAGILKAYADNDLGPFAREIVRAIRARINKW
ncbi:Hypothetical protein LUCI_2136 [Lucifera butyrica]|uniref:Pyrroline-5-carboxylate reductase catalytic N-terminal domain-containing protein n=1 Tax=Lucifera butyrica TaxID=1351585 RepID=A0A498R2N9_9FIRM|nr:NAD(P)-binding domain-containing protein [Lucifera butyrica]VBB06896.1 Hypothetical protein LUCI_2136 [Lucifera butyrica]